MASDTVDSRVLSLLYQASIAIYQQYVLQSSLCSRKVRRPAESAGTTETALREGQHSHEEKNLVHHVRSVGVAIGFFTRGHVRKGKRSISVAQQV
ncbi:hypothetical protein PIB30_082304 [Stylosanthes scabra]|uniref:Uncharacterized protein n=1 Tax=Stylosanthes scabra TaxID=79078 RepID=A0ABU6WSU9_9FABA|nr:hypothetical protein [Stylosanthes scabra]